METKVYEMYTGEDGLFTAYFATEEEARMAANNQVIEDFATVVSFTAKGGIFAALNGELKQCDRKIIYSTKGRK